MTAAADEPPRLSLIIPVRGETARLNEAIRSATPETHPDVEIIVVAAPDTPTLRPRGVDRILIADAAGRGRQLDLGARVARGDLLLFLHADTRLPAGWRAAVETALRSDGVTAGAFRLRFDDRRPSLRVIEAAANLRAGLTRLPYGDQAVFMRASTYWRLGGFPSTPIMEDVILMCRARRAGRVVFARCGPVVTSARRWRARGVVRTTLVNRLCVLGWLAGVSPATLAGWRAGQGRGRYRAVQPGASPTSSVSSVTPVGSDAASVSPM